ncbi:MAG TPA: DUF3037 domain-containing protein [Thermoanaerobaculia bacterium]|nr:DUF3037 domain-containing protein [Thermoanaerobaculia bacterium]
MPALSSFDYALLRVVPRVERQEQVNAGVILYCRERDFLAARVEIDEPRLLALWPAIDLETVRSHLEAAPKICAGLSEAGPIASLSQRERFHWLVAPRSTVIQVSPVHTGLCADPVATLDEIFERMVRLPAAGSTSSTGQRR